MDFDALVARLVAEGRPSWLVYRSAEGRSRAGYIDQCRDAWNLWPDAGTWWIVRGWGDARTEEAFPSEAEACAELYARVVATGETGVRALSLAELPAPAQRLVGVTGLTPTDQRAGDLRVLGRGAGMGLRVVETAGGYRVDRTSVLPPTVGDTWFTDLPLDDVARVVMIVAAERIPRMAGMPRWGVPSTGRGADGAAEQLAHVAQVPLERLEAAFLGAPDGVLEIVVPPAAIGFLTEGLIALAASHGYEVNVHGNEDVVSLGGDAIPGLLLRRREDGYAFEYKGEKSNTWEVRGVYPTLAEARVALVAHLGPFSLPRPSSATAS